MLGAMMSSRLAKRLTNVEEQLTALTTSLEQRLGRLEQDQAAAHQGTVALQAETERLRDLVIPDQQARLDLTEQSLREQRDHLDRRLDQVEHRATTTETELTTLRDNLLPAAVQRSEAAAQRLAGELAEVADLVERLLRQQPLPVPETPPAPAVDPGELAEVQSMLVDTFRGSEEEIRQRLALYPPQLQHHEPVLDLGSGRGELLLLLREAGLDATGIEGDAALVEAARRRQLQVIQGDGIEVLRQQADSSWGAVTAIHLLEHRAPAQLLRLLHEVHRILRPGGLLLAESPNPHSLRVGASLYWLDPTHQRPLLPETLTLFLKASGFVVDQVHRLHEFPGEQLFLEPDHPSLPAASETGLELHQHRLDRLCHRLDDLLNAPRDFAVRARTPWEA